MDRNGHEAGLRNVNFSCSPGSSAHCTPALVVIGGSAGAIPALQKLLRHLPADFPVPLVAAIHLAPKSTSPSLLRQVLAGSTDLSVKWAEDGEKLAAGVLYLAPQDRHTTVMGNGTVRTCTAPSRPRPSVDRLFASVAETYGATAIAVILSGLLADGAVGARAIAHAGGSVLVQDRTTSEFFDMPVAALAAGANALVLPPRGIGAALTALVMAPGARRWFQVAGSSSYLSSALLV